MTDTSSDESAYTVPGALGFLTNTFPALKRWAFLFRPAERDWARGARMSRVCRARGTRTRNSPFPALKGAGLSYSVPHGGTGATQLRICHRDPAHSAQGAS